MRRVKKAILAMAGAVALYQAGYRILNIFSRNDRIIVSCIGDSITSYGCASADNMTYVAQLQQILGEDKYSVSNFGKSGFTMLKNGYCTSNANDCKLGCSYWNSDMWQGALKSNPDVVTIMLGTNDAKGCNWYGPPNGSPSGLGVEFRSAFLDMVSIIKSLSSKPKVYLMIPPPLVNPPDHPDNPPPFDMRRHVINEIFLDLVPSIALETGADGVIDIWTALGGEEGYENKEMTCDGCHPKDKAMTIIAQSIADAIIMAKQEEGMGISVDGSTMAAAE